MRAYLKMEINGQKAILKTEIARLSEATGLVERFAGPGAAGPVPSVLVLVDPGINRINCIKAVRQVTGLGLKEAKDIVEHTPAAVLNGMADHLYSYTSVFETGGATGAKLEIREAQGRPEDKAPYTVTGSMQTGSYGQGVPSASAEIPMPVRYYLKVSGDKETLILRGEAATVRQVVEFVERLCGKTGSLPGGNRYDRVNEPDPEERTIPAPSDAKVEPSDDEFLTNVLSVHREQEFARCPPLPSPRPSVVWPSSSRLSAKRGPSTCLFTRASRPRGRF
jgi:large subunit ribosomal protein L7/L12